MNDAGDIDEEDMDAVSHVAFIVDKNMKLKKAGRTRKLCLYLQLKRCS